MFDRLRGQVHHVEVSMDLVIRALIVFEVAASAENANFLIQKRLAVLRLVLLPVRVAPFGSFVELVISFELLLAVREKAICAVRAVALSQVLRAQLVLLELRDERLLGEVWCRGYETEAAAAGSLGIELWSRRAIICWNECLRCWIHRGRCAEALA